MIYLLMDCEALIQARGPSDIYDRGFCKNSRVNSKLLTVLAKQVHLNPWIISEYTSEGGYIIGDNRWRYLFDSN